MNNVMAGFFLVFSFFNFLDLRGFSDVYRSYDLLARAVPAWASSIRLSSSPLALPSHEPLQLTPSQILSTLGRAVEGCVR